jgi:hypothetical protein
MQWNATCASLNDTALLEMASAVEAAIYDGLIPTMNGQTLELVYVYELCNRSVADHSGYSDSRRRAQTTPVSDIGVYTVISRECNDCQDQLFEETDSALDVIVDDGTLSAEIKDRSTLIDGVIDRQTGVMSTFTVVADSPTNAPTSHPTSGPSSNVSALGFIVVRKSNLFQWLNPPIYFTTGAHNNCPNKRSNNYTANKRKTRSLRNFYYNTQSDLSMLFESYQLPTTIAPTNVPTPTTLQPTNVSNSLKTIMCTKYSMQ